MEGDVSRPRATGAREGPVDPRADLPPEWAFVVHFRPGALRDKRQVGGRIEHVASGRVGHFRSLAELVAFAACVLGQVADAGGAPPPVEGGEEAPHGS